MANPPPSQTLPGIAIPGKFPQWGVTNPGGNLTTSGDKIAEAHNDAEKQKLINEGYLVWFGSKQAAQNFINGQTTPFLNGNIPNPLSGLAAIGDFFSRLGQASTWIRVAEVVLGIGLVVIGLATVAKGTAIGRAAATAGKAAAIL